MKQKVFNVCYIDPMKCSEGGCFNWTESINQVIISILWVLKKAHILTDVSTFNSSKLFFVLFCLLQHKNIDLKW